MRQTESFPTGQVNGEHILLDSRCWQDTSRGTIDSLIPLLEQNLLTIEQRRAIAATLVMVFTVARLAELHRAILLSTSEDEYIIQTTILKSPQRIAEFKLCKVPVERICPLRWFKSWFGDREPNIPNKAQELWRISYAEKYIQADDLSKAI
ncbi:MAG: hypothetical protein EZS28_035267 [Streblomastix strix]|uniref:Tyr recombinase domain-containing protein n=1 Tax=Streblomastix strix TaxID=222440 RepID=A0A5J4UI11_9EUKA|nr:MAG: hypothetical protein EZS28_035267 [Streblomastix strix]